MIDQDDPEGVIDDQVCWEAANEIRRLQNLQNPGVSNEEQEWLINASAQDTKISASEVGFFKTLRDRLFSDR